MAVTLTTLESNLQTKMNNTSGTTDAQEFLLLSKSVEALNPSIAVQDVIDEGTTQVAAVTAEGTTQVGLVQTEGATQVAAVQSAASGYATQADIDASVSALVDSAPATLDTLNELAAALGDDANFSTTVTNSIATKLPLAGGTLTGALDVGGELIADSYNETYAAVTSSTNATTVNCEAGNAFSHTLTENTTFTFSNPPASGTAYTFSLELIQDAAASGYTVTWPTVTWPSGTAPTLTATASGVDLFVFTTTDGGTTWRAMVAAQALA